MVHANETNVSTGFVFGNTFVFDPDNDDSYFGSPGMVFDGYSFWNNKKVGIFFHGLFAFPVVGMIPTTFNGKGFLDRLSESPSQTR
ncbi:MAG: hypothetical protein Ta2G_02030 [Termitinemataceae bacterium]|nr:MAG: hypothetical protein Ta2G_02030 [Termitinemataceae bacterium]